VSPELRHLRYFVAVAEELSFTRAAARLHMAQQPLSAAIRRMEDELGVRLLDRTTRRVELTDAGRALLDGARASIDAADGAFAAARDVGAGVAGRLVLGVAPGAHDAGQQVLSALRAAAPRLEVAVREEFSAALVAHVLDGELDAASASAPSARPGSSSTGSRTIPSSARSGPGTASPAAASSRSTSCATRRSRSSAS
jgi:DNA-binding transcriptional LysR family regulator